MLKHDIQAMEVIHLGPEQINACMELNQLALNGLWSKQQWIKELIDSRSLCMGVLKSSTLLALACGWLVVDELHLTAIGVHPQHRRQGLARLLLSKPSTPHSKLPETIRRPEGFTKAADSRQQDVVITITATAKML